MTAAVVQTAPVPARKDAETATGPRPGYRACLPPAPSSRCTPTDVKQPRLGSRAVIGCGTSGAAVLHNVIERVLTSAFGGAVPYDSKAACGRISPVGYRRTRTDPNLPLLYIRLGKRSALQLVARMDAAFHIRLEAG